MPRISVVGSINVDLTVVSARRPMSGETVTGTAFKMSPGGKGANQAVAIARLGADVELFGCVGSDSNGAMMKENLNENGVVTDSLKTVCDKPTGVALITITDNDNSIIVVPGANGCVGRHYIDSVKEKLLSSSVVLLQHEIPFDTVQYAIRLCHTHGIPVILNPAPAMPVCEELIEMVSYITPNEHEVEALLNTGESMNELMLRFPFKLIVTLGANGVSYSDGKSIINVPAIAAKVVDTTGAGDTFSGAFAKAISDGADLHEAIVFAQYASGLSVEKFGAQGGMPTMQEICERKSKDNNTKV